MCFAMEAGTRRGDVVCLESPFHFETWHLPIFKAFSFFPIFILALIHQESKTEYG